MNYTDSVFLLFFCITFGAYYIARSAALQTTILVAGSMFFYSWEAPALLLVFLCSWAVTSLSSRVVLTSTDRRQARLFAVLGVVINLGLLAFFKYKFLVMSPQARSPGSPPQALGEWLLLAPLPIGISFYTFHGISLLVDVYRGNKAFDDSKRQSLPRHLGQSLLYLVFFPQLIAGPIIKAKDFFPQVRFKRLSDVDFDGSARILITGYFLKSVVADNLSPQTLVIGYPYYQWKSSFDLVVLLYGYSAQIFADFAGYSLIAIGLARLLGYRLPANFNFPYAATSIADFWRRWHISLSSWLRDYLYIPMGGSKVPPVRVYFNLIMVMFLGGLWHGAAWSFAVWGLWHGIGLALERPFASSPWMTSRHPLAVAARVFLVFNFVTLGWLFFKLQTFSDAWGYLNAMIHSQVGGVSALALLLISLYGSCVVAYHVWGVLYRPRGIARDILLGAMLFLVLTAAGPSTPFIYFQF